MLLCAGLLRLDANFGPWHLTMMFTCTITLLYRVVGTLLKRFGLRRLPATLLSMIKVWVVLFMYWIPQDEKKIPKWQFKSCHVLHIVVSPLFAHSVGVGHNLQMNILSNQFDLVYDIFFLTVHLHDKRVPPG